MAPLFRILSGDASLISSAFPVEAMANDIFNRLKKAYQSGLLFKLKVFASHRNVQMSLFCIQPELSLQFFESP